MKTKKTITLEEAKKIKERAEDPNVDLRTIAESLGLTREQVRRVIAHAEKYG
jgi:DNA-binding transcriptional regulator LsrR (DeoR family)